MIRSWKGMHPKIHPSAFVSEAAYVIGEVEIGEHSSVWPGAVIRGDCGLIAIGKNTNIQDGSVVHSDHPARIGNGVTIGHSVVCHAKEIDDNCLIGNNATINDGVKIGEWSIVAANSVVLENIQFHSQSFVLGIPAKVKSEITKKQMAMIREVATHYGERCREYKKEAIE